jgi:ADP-ribose pyrophosphatase YjhB (NUDIX family)
MVPRGTAVAGSQRRNETSTVVRHAVPLTAWCETLGMSAVRERSVKVAGFVLPLRERSVLLARHTYGPKVWAMLGGMAAPGEAPDVAARREVREESCLEVTADRLLAVCDDGDLLLFVFAGRVLGGAERPDGTEIAELRWFDATQLDRPDVFELVPRLLSKRSPEEAGLRPEVVGWPDGARHTAYLTSWGNSG